MDISAFSKWISLITQIELTPSKGHLNYPPSGLGGLGEEPPFQGEPLFQLKGPVMLVG